MMLKVKKFLPSRRSQWFEGLLTAEEMMKNNPAKGEKLLLKYSKATGNPDSFSRGVLDYLIFKATSRGL